MKLIILFALCTYSACELRIVQRGKELREKLEEEALSAAGKIVNGESTTISRYPWQVSLQSSILPPIFPFSHICGGAIINAKWVVTAAHCVDGTSASSLQIRAGGTEHTAATSTISVSRVIMHPSYNGNGAGYPNDIALLELSSSLQLGTNTVDKIRLAEPRDGDMAGQRCWLSGWGRTSGGSNTLPATLQHVGMTVIYNSECTNRWSSVSGAAINDKHICIFEEPKSACNGDSGGPMSCNMENNDPVLAGVTSWGISTCDGTYPSVYTRMSEFFSWIQSQCSNCV